MKYVALLRGINVGGKAAVKMSLLKEAFEKEEFKNVSTYINSGNVIFDSGEIDSYKLEEKIEKLLIKSFFPIKTVVISQNKLESILNQAPKSWGNEDLRKYIAFIKSPITYEEIVQETDLKDGIDFIDKGPGVVYMSTKMSGLMKSNFPKLITKKVYKEITMRNYNTVLKLHELMDEK